MMNKYRQIRITEDHTDQQKEFYRIFPYQRPIKPQDYTLSKYLKKDQDWLEEKGCSPEYQDESTTFEYLISFIEADIITIQDINCIPNTVGRTIIEINYTSKQRNKYFFTRRVVLQKLRDYLDNLPYFEKTKGTRRDILYCYKFQIEKYIINQKRNNPNLEIIIDKGRIKINGKIRITKITQELQHKIKSYFKYQPNKTHYCGINIGNNFIYQPYNSNQKIEWKERYDQCQ